MAEILITGGAGFFGGILKRRLLAEGHACVSIDLQPDEDRHPNLISVQGDIRSRDTVERLFAGRRITTIYHCAAILAHARHDNDFLWTSNVEGTRVVAEAARRHQAERIAYTSSNCLWGRSFDHAVAEDQPPSPIELYGRSKLEGERILKKFSADMAVVSLRCPTIIDAGRLGLLSILFEFIDENRKVWVVGNGSNRYQFIYAQDLADACLRLMNYGDSDVFNIGSDDVKSMRDVYQYVIDNAGSGARVAALPKRSTVLAMKIAYHLRLSPLGPYHYRMIAENFLFETSHIKERLGWSPTLTNEQMLLKSYEHYRANREAISKRVSVSDHRKPAEMGVIRLLKWLS
jgi:nucleoside-diphosphate-sugar epimerase